MPLLSACTRSLALLAGGAAARRALTVVPVGALLCMALAACGPAARVSSRSTPIPDRSIDLAAQCAQTEEDGYREQATLRVRDNTVEALAWELWVGRRGACRFDLGDFRQTRRRPHIELQARDGSRCRLLVWQDPRQVTLAHADCASRCTPGIYDEAWPVGFDSATGRCARRD